MAAEMFRYGAALALVILATACATAYAPKDITGGYAEEWRSPTELEVFFHHNDLLTVEQAAELAARRAAELALESGRRYFVAWGERLHRQKIAGPQYAIIQVRLVDGPEEGALDAVAVVQDTESLARGSLSAKARGRLAEIIASDRTP